MTVQEAIRLVAAERRGRALAARIDPAAGDVWTLEIGPDEDGAALLTAARWVARLGAEARVVLSPRTGEDPVRALLTESARLQGQVVEQAARVTASRLATAGGRGAGMSLPDASEAWGIPLPAMPRMIAKAPAGSSVMTCAQCRDVDRRATGEFGVPGLCLMENAAVAAAAVALDMLARTPGTGPVVVAAGGGNNGGDGLAVARGLRERGIPVVVALFKPAEALAGDALANRRMLEKVAGAPIHALHDRPEFLSELLREGRLVVDALLGTGFKGGLAPVFRAAVGLINGSGKSVLALDIPSGLDGDSGEVVDAAVRADRTVTFAAVKTGLTRGDGPRFAGELYLGDIGAPTAALGADV